MKKLLFLAGAACMVLLLSASVFAGGQQEGTAGAEGKTVTISFWHYYTEDTPVYDSLMWVIDQYEESNPNVTIKPRAIPFGEHPKEVAKAYTIGDPPNISLGGPRIGRFMTDGYADISNFIEGSDIISEEKYFPGSWKECTYQGEVNGISHDSNTIVLFWNKDYYSEVGLDPNTPPRDWDELKVNAKSVGNISSDVFGFSYTAPKNELSTWQFLPIFWSMGAKLGEVNSEDGVEALNYWADLYKEKIVPPDVLNLSQNDQMDQFAAQNFGMIFDGPWDFYKLEDVDFNWGATILPKGEINASSLGGENIYIFEGDNVKESFEFLEWTQRNDFLTEWMSRAGRVPSKTAVAQSTDWKYHDDPNYAVVVEQLQYAKPRFYPQWSDFSIPLQTAIQKTLTGQATAQEALDETAAAYKEKDLIQLYENW